MRKKMLLQLDLKGILDLSNVITRRCFCLRRYDLVRQDKEATEKKKLEKLQEEKKKVSSVKERSRSRSRSKRFGLICQCIFACLITDGNVINKP